MANVNVMKISYEMGLCLRTLHSINGWVAYNILVTSPKP